MARIVYAVAGEGFGHSSRSHITSQHLIDAGHDVIFAGSHKSYSYLSQYFGDRVHEVFGLRFAYEKGQIAPFKTVIQNLSKLAEANKINDKLFNGIYEKFKPELIITDFEPFTAWWAWRKKIPFISIDHEHMISHCDLGDIEVDPLAKLNAQLVTRFYYFQAAAYIVINFFKAPAKSKRVIASPPIVRKEVTALESSKGDSILMYSTTGSEEAQLVSTLKKFPQQKFIIYGFDITKESENCTFKPRSTEGFLKDLASCRGVIASAGFSLLSECLYLKKKMLLLPIPGQYEQQVNAHYIEKLNLGIRADNIDESSIARFLDSLKTPLPTNNDILWPDNEAFFKLLDTELKKLGH